MSNANDGRGKAGTPNPGKQMPVALPPKQPEPPKPWRG